MSDKHAIPSDEELTAFLDGELNDQDAARIAELAETNEAVAERIAMLGRMDELPLRDAFQPLLAEAPKERLAQMLDTAAKPRPQWTSRRGFVAAIAASIAAGVIVDRTVISMSGGPETNTEWREAVAQYISLYTAETIAGAPPGREVQAIQLASVNERLGTALTLEAVALPGAEFKRAQILSYDSRALAQIIYADPKGQPLALCIISARKQPTAIASEQRFALNIAFWSGHDYSAMLIGHLPEDDIRGLAEDVKARIDA